MRLLALCTVILLNLAVASPVRAALFVVNTVGVDLIDADLDDGICDADLTTPGAQCTLRAAIMQANHTPAHDVIALPLGATITLNLGGLGVLGDLNISTPMTITGALFGFPADLSQLPLVQGDHGQRLFDVSGAGVEVLFQGMRLEGGDAGASNGGAIRAGAGTLLTVDRVRFRLNRAQSGGAIFNAGVMEILESEFDRNRAVEGGAAVMNNGFLTFRASSIRNIRDDPSLGNPDAIRSGSGSALIVENSTINGSATGLGATDTGGITLNDPALAHIRNSTLNNFTHYALIGTLAASSDVVVANSILYASGIDDCNLSGSPAASVQIGYSQIGGGNCHVFYGPGVSATPPLLGNLISNANALTFWHEPSFASSVVDAGSPGAGLGADPIFDCLSHDQRGLMRPLDGNANGISLCDKGAVELATLPMATFEVNVFDQDLIDADLSDGVCDVDLATPGPQCTLRAAVMQANAKPGPDRIRFINHPDNNEIVLDIPPAGEPNAATGDLNITEQVHIDGVMVNGRPVTTVVQTAADRIFNVDLPTGQFALIEELRLTGGNSAATGGAILAQGAGLRLTLNDVEFFNNHAGAGGGAVASSIRLEINRSDLHGNSAGQAGAAVRMLGSGAILSMQRSSAWNNFAADAIDTQRTAVYAGIDTAVYLANSTLSGNSGGVLSFGYETDIRASTVVDNDEFGVRAVRIDGEASNFILRSTILAGNSASDCAMINDPPASIDHYNLIADGSCAGGASNIQASPNLAPALTRFDGHVSRVRVPLVGSPVMDAVPDELFNCPDNDQLGRPRPIDTFPDVPGVFCEIGAMELFPAESNARAFTVNTFANDQIDLLPGDTRCDVSSATGDQCTLRAAVMEANALPGINFIEIPTAEAVITLTRAPQAGPDSAAHGDLDITAPLQILGVSGAPQVRPQVVAGHGDRIFDIDVGGGGDVLIRGLRLSGGSTTASGGAIRVLSARDVTLERMQMSANSADLGGGALAVLNGSAVLRESDLHNNATAGFGAAIRNESSLTVERSSIRGNLDFSDPAQRQAIGAGIDSLTLVRNSTLSGNSGSGISVNNGTVGIDNATIAGNDRFGISFGTATGQTLFIANSILVGNGAGACATAGGIGVTVSVDHYNLADSDGCDFSAGASNLALDADAALGPLIVNPDRFSAHHLPAAHSAAIDAGHPTVGGVGCLGSDQFGTARPVDGTGNGVARCDIGAVEAPTRPLGTGIFANGFED